MIPTIDLAGLAAGDEGARARVGGEIADVYSEVGFAYVSNHGIEGDVIEAAFDASRRFHRLPIEAKSAIEINEHHRGYIPINTSTTRTSTVDDVRKPNQSASLMVMHEVPEHDERLSLGVPLAGPNQWPTSLPDIKAPLLGYVDAMSNLAHALVGAIEHALDAERGSLQQHFSTPTTFLRLLHYPPTGASVEEGSFGSAPHSDYGFLTLLAQDNVGGLQVRRADGAWLDVPPRPECLVLNTADILHRWSNGRLISTPHRVLPSGPTERFSLPFFFDPDVRTVVEPLPSCVGPRNPPRYEPVVYGDYLMHRLRTNHQQHQPPPAAPSL